MSEKQYSEEYIQHTFTEDEKKEIAAEMARNVSEKSNLEDDKKARNSEFNGKIDLLQAQVNLAAGKLNSGYEHIYVKCEVVRNYETKRVGFFRVDTGEMVKDRDMTDDELQMQLPTGGDGP